MDRFLKVFIGYLCLLAISISCTREVKQPASIVINPPKSSKVGAQSTKQLKHVVINIRDGANNLVMPAFHWDSECHNCATNNTPPAGGFAFDLVPGPGYLLQVIAVYQDTASSFAPEEFYYGDVRTEIVSGSNNVFISVNQVGVGSGTEFRIAGRYLETAAIGPTGTVVTSFQPSNGSPAMELETSGIYNGWFDFFTIDGANLTYQVKETGLNLFSNLNVSASNPSLVPANYRLHLDIPTGYRKNHGPNNTYTAEAFNPQKLILGYFGESSLYSTSKICFPYADITTEAYIDGALATQMVFDHNGDGGASEIKVSGGVMDFVNCDGSATQIEMDPKYFQGWAGEVVPFDGPLKALDFGDYRNIFQWNYNSSTSLLSINWEYWQNASDNIEGIEFFLSPGDSDGPGESCEDAVPLMNSLGFVPKAQNTFSTVISNAQLSGNSIVACARIGGTYVGSTLRTHIRSQDLANPPKPANRIEIVMNENPLTTGLCQQVEIRNYENSSWMTPSTPFPYSMTTTNGTVYTDAACSTPVVNPLSMTSSSTYFYVKASTDSTGSTLFADATDLQIGDASVNFSSGPLQLRKSGPAKLALNQCYRFEFELIKANGQAIVAESHPGYTITLSANASYTYYTNTTDCNGPTNAQANTLTINSGTGYASTYVRLSSDPGGGNYDVISSISNGLPTPANNAIAIGDGSLLPHHLKLLMPTTLHIGQCYPVKVELQNWDGVPVPTSSMLNIDYDMIAGNAQFYNTGSCSTTTSSIMITSNDSATSGLYIRAEKLGPLNIKLKSGNLILPGDAPFNASVITPASGTWGYFELNIPKSITLGDHNFPLPAQVVGPAGASFSCSDDYGATWGDCSGKFNQASGQFTVDQFFFSASEFRFRIFSGSDSHEFTIMPTSVFSGVSVVTCQQVAMSNTNMVTVRDGIAGQASSTNYCIGNNITVSSDGTGGEYITIDNYKKLVGYYDVSTKAPSSVISVTHNVDGLHLSDTGTALNLKVAYSNADNTKNAIKLLGITTGTAYIDGVHIEQDCMAATGKKAIAGTDTPSGSGSLVVKNSYLKGLNCPNSAALLYFNRAFNITVQDSKIELATTGGNNYYINWHSPYGSNTLQNLKFIHTNPQDNHTFSGINITYFNAPAASPSMMIDNVSINTIGSSFYISGDPAYPLQLTVKNSDFIDAVGGAPSSPLIEVGDDVNFTFEDNIFDSVANTNRFMDLGTGSGIFRRNIVRANSAYPLIFSNNGGATYNIDMDDNQFIAATNTGAAVNFYSETPSPFLTFNTSYGSIADWGNRVCSNNGSTPIWTMGAFPVGNLNPATVVGGSTNGRCN